MKNVRLNMISAQAIVDSLSLRQAKVLLEMLKLGSFAVADIASSTGEGEHYIQNLICDSDGAIKKLHLLSPVSNVKRTGPGAPAKVWAIALEKQDEVLSLLAPHSQSFEAERRVNRPVSEPAAAVSEPGDTEEFVYRFVRHHAKSPISSESRVGTTISIQTTDGGVEFCAPQIHQVADIAGERDAILVDSTSIANGLAAICQMRPGSRKGVTAVVNYRDGEAHFVFLRKGIPMLSSVGQLQEGRKSGLSGRAPELSAENQHLILAQLQAAIHLYRTSTANEEINEILITGNLRAPSEICNLISNVMHVRCEFLDPFESFTFSAKSIKQQQSRNAIMNCVPEIGYAFKQLQKQWQFDRRNDALWLQNQPRHAFDRLALWKMH